MPAAISITPEAMRRLKVVTHAPPHPFCHCPYLTPIPAPVAFVAAAKRENNSTISSSHIINKRFANKNVNPNCGQLLRAVARPGEGGVGDGQRGEGNGHKSITSCGSSDCPFVLLWLFWLLLLPACCRRCLVNFIYGFPHTPIQTHTPIHTHTNTNTHTHTQVHTCRQTHRQMAIVLGFQLFR